MLFLALSPRDDPSWDSLVACLRMKNYLFVGIRSAGAIHDLGNSQMAFHHQQTSNLLNRFPIKFIAKFFCRSQRNIKIKVDGLLLLVFIGFHWILVKNKGNSITCCSRFHGHFCHSSKICFLVLQITRPPCCQLLDFHSADGHKKRDRFTFYCVQLKG